MDFTLNATQRKIVNAAIKDEVRPVLQCVHVRRGMVEAANGFILVQRRIDYDGEEEVLLDIDQIAKHEDSKAMGHVVYAEGKEGEFRALGKDTYLVQRQSGAFPNTGDLWPQQDPVFRIALGRSHLIRLLKCFDKDEEMIEFTFYGARKAVKFEHDNGEVKGLIMPILTNRTKEAEVKRKGKGDA